MIVPDINLLIYAYNDGAPYHHQARAWWEGVVNGNTRVGLPWVVTTGFVRLMTHPRALAHPLSHDHAMDHLDSWFRYPHITTINPGPKHLIHLRQCLEQAGTGGNLVTDAHLAALAIEYQAEVHSNDLDFNRFAGLRWRNPLEQS
ncbi:MAG: type II toxin-antitoxin system VapC family toxin [Verrucomicrobia bacterium]|nr:type II toxin-antitoxin system VapC family toxin [Verrucomicrobiota bacterium]